MSTNGKEAPAPQELEAITHLMRCKAQELIRRQSDCVSWFGTIEMEPLGTEWEVKLVRRAMR